MKLTTDLNERVHVLDSHTNVWTVMKKIANSGMQEDAFYVCDLGDIVRKYKIWKSALPRVKPYYAVKCNDSYTVLDVLAKLGTGFDCASKNEIAKVLSTDIKPNRIIYANPAKQSNHITYAKSVGVDRMTFDSEMELKKISQLYPTAHLVIRIRCDAIDAQCQLGMKFGCDPINEAPQLLLIARSLNLNVIGVSFHVGSGCREPDVYRRAIKSARNLFDFAQTLGFRLNFLDIGGGYPGDFGKSIQQMSDVINLALDKYFPINCDDAIDIIAEPGRFFVSSAFTLACNIHSLRTVVQRNEITNEPNLHHMYFINDGVYGSFNCLMYDHQIVEPQLLNQDLRNGKYYSSSIWGPTCDGLDKVYDEILLPELNIGDWLVFENMGAYTLTAASTFNGFPIPEVHIVATESIWLLLKDILPLTEQHFVFGNNSSNMNGLNTNNSLLPIQITINRPVLTSNNTTTTTSATDDTTANTTTTTTFLEQHLLNFAK